jgi:hypothetical protein
MEVHDGVVENQTDLRLRPSRFRGGLHQRRLYRQGCGLRHRLGQNSAEATGKQTVWIQNRAAGAERIRARVKSLMATKTIDIETAVQVALLEQQGPSGCLYGSRR